MPAAIGRGLAAGDSAHVWCEGGRAFLVDDAGGVVSDQAQVVPAPSGGWRVRVEPKGVRTLLQVIGPDGEPRGEQIHSASPVPTWIDASHLGYCLVDEFNIGGTSTGKVGLSYKLGDAIMTVGPDGHSVRHRLRRPRDASRARQLRRPTMEALNRIRREGSRRARRRQLELRWLAGSSACCSKMSLPPTIVFAT